MSWVFIIFCFFFQSKICIFFITERQHWFNSSLLTLIWIRGPIGKLYRRKSMQEKVPEQQVSL